MKDNILINTGRSCETIKDMIVGQELQSTERGHKSMLGEIKMPHQFGSNTQMGPKMMVHTQYEQIKQLETNFSNKPRPKFLKIQCKPPLCQATRDLDANIDFSPYLSSIEDQKRQVCQICCSNYIYVLSSFALYCGHRFCNECIRKYVKHKIKSRQVLKIQCAQDGCIEEYSEEVVKGFVDPNTFLYYRFQKNQCVDNSNPEAKQCCRQGCHFKVKQTSYSRQATCFCGQQMCFRCGDKWHEQQCEIKTRPQNLNKVTRTQEIICCKQSILVDQNSYLRCNICYQTYCNACRRKQTSRHEDFYNFWGCPYKSFCNVVWMPIYLLYMLGILTRLFIIIFGTPFYLIYLFFRSIADSYNRAYQVIKDQNCDGDDYLIVICFFGLFIYFSPLILIFYFYPLNFFRLYLIPLKISICGE